MRITLPTRSCIGLAVIALTCFSITAAGQLSGTRSIPGDYPTIASAVNAVNASGVGAGGVIFNIAANHTETITTTISLKATGTVANPIVFQKDPSTSGANPVIMAYTNGTGTPATAVQDGIWRLRGSDYVTIDGIDVTENPDNSSNPSTMEYGYALYKASTSNGCQFVTIRNCVITLNRINNATGTAPMADGSTGIIVMNAIDTLAVTNLTPVAGGTNSYNRFYSNTIQNCNTGIALIGYTASSALNADAYNDIGGADASTGNTIINYGGSAGALNAAAGIRTLSQYELNISYNTINSNNGAGVNHPQVLRGIFAGTSVGANAVISHNTVTLKGGGTTHHIYGIENASGAAFGGNTVNISNNILSNSSYATATSGGYYGIRNSANPVNLIISSNTVSDNSSSASSTGFLYGILNSGTATNVTMNSNIVTGNSITGLSSGLFTGIYNSSTVSNLDINNNTIAGNSSTSLLVPYSAIYNSGSVNTTLNINNNNIGSNTLPAFTFNAANSATQTYINNTGGVAPAALSISNNNFQGITYAVAGTGSNTFILNSAATKSQVINGNTFTNLNLNTSGSVTFISNSVALPSNGTQSVSNNSIVGSFNKASSGTVTLFTNTATSPGGSIVTQEDNNFSNITVAGSANIAGWVNTDAGASSKTIRNNTFGNWTGGTGTITGMAISLTGSGSVTTGNAINNFSSAGTIAGISTSAGNDRIYSNIIHTLASSGLTSTTVSGISVTAGTTKNIYENTIYNLVANSISSGSVRGIVVTGGAGINIYQNTIYSLQANSLTTGNLSAIWITSGTTIGIHRNKIYDISSSSTALSSGIISGIQVSGSAVSNITISGNLIGDLRASATGSIDAIRGLSLISTGLNSTIKVYNNTIYLNAVSTGANFGSTGVYHTTSATATTAALDLRNNIIVNISVPNGAGLTVAYRRSSTALANYAASSNNNLFYAGTAASNRLIFYDALNLDQFLSTYKPRVSSRDVQSVTEDLLTASKFLSTTGSSASFLHLDSTKSTQAESGAGSIASVLTDFDGQPVQGSAGYGGTGTAPDIGADEIGGTSISALSGIYNVGTGQIFTSLTNADGLFANINSRGLSGNVIVKITSDLTEDGSNVLYQWVEQVVGNYTLTIQPDASTDRLISGNVLNGMIRFNGVKRVTVDGSNGTGNRYLTFRNNNTAGSTGTAFSFINGASNNLIKYSNIEAYANATNGVILFSTSTVAGGNSNNTISFCDINATVGGSNGNVAIFSAGTAGKENSVNTISNNLIHDYRDRGLDLTATGSSAWNISGNSFYNGDVAGLINYAAASTLHGIRISGGTGYLIANNYIGGNATSSGGTPAVYGSTTGNVSFQGIQLTTTAALPASTIKGNTISNISISSVPTASGLIAFAGIETAGSGITVGSATPGEGNMIGSDSINGSISITTSTTSSSNTTSVRPISFNSSGGAITGNRIGGFDIRNIGTVPAASSFIGIYINNPSAPSQVSNNTVGTAAIPNSIRVLATSMSGSTTLTGILIGSSVISNVLLDGNIVQNLSNNSTANTNGTLSGIASSAATAAANITISNNTVSSLFVTGFNAGSGTPTSSYFIGINNTGAAGTVRIISNTLTGFSTNSTSGNFNAIRNSGAVISSIQINNNQIGNSTTPAITFNAANSASQIFINNTGGAATASVSISNNNIQGVVYAAGGSSSNTYILNSAATLSQTINSNTFTNLNITTTGSIVFISNNVVVPVNGTQNVNSNSISGTFTKTGAGTVTLFTSTASSVSGSTINNNSNNFSNITVTGAGIIAGWINTDAGASTKTIQNNTFSNWTGGTGAITAMSVNLTGTANSTTGNLINNISSAGAITGIATGTGNDNIYLNVINSLTSTGNSVVTGISITSGATKNIYRNKIYDLQSTSTSTGTVNGILVSGTTISSINIYNNLIGDLRTPSVSATDPIRGISVTATALASSVNVYYNTIYLNASSTGTNFGSSGIYHTSSSTATTATLNLRNNSITNTSIAKGSGLTVTFRRSAAALDNYASTSNNNLFYAGTPGISKLIYYASGSSDQTLSSYKSRVANRDSLSVTDNLTSKYLSTSGSSTLFLHMDAAQPSSIESGAMNIPGFTTDVDAQVRAGNTGYTGLETFPDIGADEVFGIENVPPVITYTLITDTTSATNRSIGNVVISDLSGISNNSGTKPRIYYKRFSDANVWLDNASSTNGWKFTEATNDVSPYNFTIDYSLLHGGAAVTAGTIQYFIVAQDLSTVSNVAINSGTFNAIPASVALTAAAFPIGATINSYNIPFSGSYDIGTGEVFTSLTKADGLFASINSAGLMGNTTFNIISDITEDGANALNQWTEYGVGNYTLTIQPDAASARTISGNVVTGLIRFNGADRVTIDGSYGGDGNYLRFRNTSTTGTTGTAFTFINGASDNSLKFISADAYANSINGVILFGTSTAAAGNNNNLVDNSIINATVAANSGNVAIYSGGTTGKENSGNTISNNIISGYRDRGLDIGATGSKTWSILGNSFYNGDITSSINYNAASALHGIRILGGSGYSIVNNYIGGSGPLASGTNAIYSATAGNLSWQGILLTTTSGSPASYIKGNTIAAVSVSSVPTAFNSVVFMGIAATGAGINIGGTLAGDGNIIGSNTVNGSISVTTTTTSTTNTSFITGINSIGIDAVISGNQVGGIDIVNIGSLPAASTFTGVYLSNTTSPSLVTGNIIGSNVISNSVRVMSNSTATTTNLQGISLGAAINSDVLLSDNLVANLGNLSVTSSGTFTGIRNLASGGLLTIVNDTILNILTAANSSAASGIYTGIYSGGPVSITNSLISNISALSTGPNTQVIGIDVSGVSSVAITDNIITGLSTASTKVTANPETDSPAGSVIIGLLNSSAASGQVISNNRFGQFNALSTSAANVLVTGIGVTANGSGNIFGNRFGSLTNLSTGGDGAINNINAAGGSFNVYNNTLRISNLLNTNTVKIYGIIHSSATMWNYFHNTVRVGGSSAGTPVRSAAFLLSGNSSPVLKNNLFFNIRTGTGYHYAISNLGSPPSNWPADASDYNDFYSMNPGTVAEWGSGISKTFAEWQGLSGGDVHSVSNSISFITSLYDLEPDSITNCSFNNAGIPITSPVLVNTDLRGNPRDNEHPDMGAYEFNYKGFTIVATSNSPVCGGDSLQLTVDPGEAFVPSYSWRNPSGVVISTSKDPVVPLVEGQYTVTVADSTGCIVTDSIIVTLNERPTATITSVNSVCDSSFVNLNISVTGTGLITGTLSNGDVFSGTAPMIVVPVFVTTTTSFSIVDLADENCISILEDLPDTVTVTVTKKGDWLGITSNWSDPINWCEGVVPTSSTSVTISSDVSIMPVITDSAYCNNLTIANGDTLTIAVSGTLHIAGTLTNQGVYLDNGSTTFNGVSGQQTFSGVSTFNNLTVNNGNGLLLSAPIVVKTGIFLTAGILDANNINITIKGNWTNNASVNAFTAGTATVLFNGNKAQAISGTYVTSFNNLTISDTSTTLTLGVNTSVRGNLSILSGTFDLSAFTANRFDAGGVLTVSNNATLKIGGTNSYPTNYSTNTLEVASTVEYSGTNQIVTNKLYGNLKLSSSAGAVEKTFPATDLTVGGNFSTVSGAGTSVSFTAASNITVNGNVSIGVSTIFNGSNFLHRVGGNWINNGTFNGNTGTVTFTGTGALVSGSGIQNFNNLTVSASLVKFSADSISLTGNLSTTGAGSFTQAPGGTLLMTGTGKTISGSGISLDNLTVTGTVSTSVPLNLTGNLSISGSFTTTTTTITMSGVSKLISGTGAKNFGVLFITGSVTTDADFSISSGLTVSGSFTASAGTATFTGTSSLGGTANLFNIIINGTALQLGSNSELGIAGILTITSGVLNATASGYNTVNFNGTGNQDIHSQTYSNLILSNGNTKTAVGDITTTYHINIGAGTTFNSSGYGLSVYGNWINDGTFVAGTGTVSFLGSANATVKGATIFNILTSNTSSSSTELVLQSNISADIVNMTNGIITTGTNTLTITNTRTGNGFIYGNIQRTHAFTTGVPYAFEGPENTISFSAVSGVTSVTVSVIREPAVEFPFGGSISRVYDVVVPTGTYTATLRLHYEDNETNGGNESSMTIWHYSTLWGSIGKTANNTTSNYVEHDDLTNITGRWTMSDNINLVQWDGSESSDWNDADNWTVLQGSASAPPSATDIVDLGTAVFTNQPTISTNVTVRSIFFGSTTTVTLNLAAGGTLTTLGDIDGHWMSPATHTINVNDQDLTVGGDFKLSDDTTGHIINLNIGNGTVTTHASLTEKGDANITFSGAGTLNIHKDFNYSSGTFTAGSGTVIYDGDENQHIAHINYNHLVVNKTEGIASIDSIVNIAGNLTVSSGELENFSTITVSGDVVIDSGAIVRDNQLIRVGGNWTNNGTYNAVGSSVLFNGTGTQYISATSFGNLNVHKTSGIVIVTGNLVVNGDVSMSSGTVDIQTYSLIRVVPGGIVTLGDSATIIIGGNTGPTGFSAFNISPASTLIFNGVSTQYLLMSDNGLGNVIFRNAGPKVVLGPIRVNSNLTIENGATLNATTFPITLFGNWINHGNFIPSAGSVSLNGVAKTISGVTTFNRLTVSGSYTFLNDFTCNGLLNITSTGSVRGGDSIHTTMKGDLTNSGDLYTLGEVTFTGNVLQTLRLINSVQTVVATVNFNGSVSPVLNSSTTPRYGYLNINNTGGVYPSTGWNILYSLTVGSGASFNGGNYTHNLLGSLTNNGTITSSGILNFTPSSTVTLNLGNNFSSTGVVDFGGTGSMTIAGTPVSFYDVIISNTNPTGIVPSSDWIIKNNFTLNGSSIFYAGNHSFFIGKDILNNGSINSGTSTFTIDGAGTQFINSPSAFNNLTINKTTGSVVLSSGITVNATLNFTGGNIQTGVNTLVMPSTGTVTGAAQNTGWVNGKLQKYIAAGPASKSFEVGDATSYAPVSLEFSDVTTGGNLTASTVAGDHPALSSSGINVSASANRFWTLTNNSIAFTNYAATFNFLTSDVDAGANTSAFEVGLYNNSSWIMPATVSPNATNISATTVTTFGEFASGEVCYKGSTISYPTSPYCSNEGVANVTLTGSGGGSYSSTAGLSINAGTGAINLASSTPGTYVVTYTIAATAGCRLFSTTTNIIISAAPSATLSYTGSPYCAGAGSSGISFTGITGGVYSSTPGLSVDSITGAVNIGTSTAGTYTVTYTLAASEGCGQYQATTNITISTPPSAVISYAGSPYCNSAGIATVTLTGTAGAVYSSTAGLSINPATGAINMAASTAGTYIVSYTISPANGCGQFIATTSVTITPAPSATISYSGSPFCNLTGVVAVIITGTEHGTFSSTAGLSIDGASGEVNTGTSAAGTYLITYTVDSYGGCAQFSTTTNITIAVPGTWTGAVSNDWNTAGNWLCGAIPTATTNVIIPGSRDYYPLLNSGIGTIQDVLIDSGASLTIMEATLQIGGNINNNGTFDVREGEIEINGSSAQTIPAAAFYGNTIGSLAIRNNSGVILGGPLSLTGVLTIADGTLASNGYLRLKSSATETARIAPITSQAGIPVTGNVIVERFIPGRRKYRLITSPVTTSASATLVAGQEALSIWGNWQNMGNNTVPNVGSLITGGSAANGFDPGTPNASLFTYDDVSRLFIGHTTANGKNTKYTPLKAGVAYFMFVYGDRLNTIFSTNPHNTSLVSTGTILTGDQVYNSASVNPLSSVTGRFTLLGNPYVSAIDWATIQRSDLTNTYWGWDPNLSSTGGYITVSTLGYATITAPYSGNIGLNQHIQPGQGFFVRTSGPSPAMTIREQNKVAEFNATAFRGPGTPLSLFAINLQYTNAGNKVLADGVVTVFDDGFSNEVGVEDASKMVNAAAEGIALLNTGELLSIDGRKMPTIRDTLFLNVSKLTKAKYSFQIFANKMLGSNVRPYLQDKYLDTDRQLMLNDTNIVDFDVDAAVPASYNSSRFQIVFKVPIVLTVRYASVQATKTNTEDVRVQWEIAEEAGISEYGIQRSSDGINFSTIGKVKSRGNNPAQSYEWLDENPQVGNNYYRIRAEETDGTYLLSKTVIVNIAAKATVIKVFPNPIQQGKINLFVNPGEKADYTVILSDREGRQIFKQVFTHTGGPLSRILSFDRMLPGGIYYLVIMTDKTKFVEAIRVE
ncbi:MAG: hypothetical protein ABWZ25_13985 [Chitinophagaceae bacterium]